MARVLCLLGLVVSCSALKRDVSLLTIQVFDSTSEQRTEV